VCSVAGTVVSVRSRTPAYPLTFLLREGYQDIPDRDAQVAFLAPWLIKATEMPRGARHEPRPPRIALA